MVCVLLLCVLMLCVIINIISIRFVCIMHMVSDVIYNYIMSINIIALLISVVILI